MKIMIKKPTTVSAITWKEDDMYIARCLEIELASQGSTQKEALKNLQEALDLYLEDESPLMAIPTLQKTSLVKLQLPRA